MYAPNEPTTVRYNAMIDMTILNLAAVGSLFSLFDTATVHFFQWSTWIDFRSKWDLDFWIFGFGFASLWVFGFQNIRDYLSALPFASELRDQNTSKMAPVVDELIWKIKYASCTNNSFFLSFVLLQAGKYILLLQQLEQGGMHFLDKIHQEEEGLFDHSNGDPWHDFVVGMGRIMLTEKFVEKFVKVAKQERLANFVKTLVEMLVAAVVLSSSIAFDVAKELVLREASSHHQADSNNQDEKGKRLRTDEKIDVKETMLSVAGMLIAGMAIVAFSSFFFKVEVTRVAVALWYKPITDDLRKAYSEIVFTKYSPASAPKVQLGWRYTCLTNLYVRATCLFTLFYWEEYSIMGIIVMLCCGIYSTAHWDATYKLNKHRRTMKTQPSIS